MLLIIKNSKWKNCIKKEQTFHIKENKLINFLGSAEREHWTLPKISMWLHRAPFSWEFFIFILFLFFCTLFLEFQKSESRNWEQCKIWHFLLLSSSWSIGCAKKMCDIEPHQPADHIHHPITSPSVSLSITSFLFFWGFYINWKINLHIQEFAVFICFNFMIFIFLECSQIKFYTLEYYFLGI